MVLKWNRNVFSFLMKLLFLASPSIVSAVFPPLPTQLEGSSFVMEVGVDDHGHAIALYGDTDESFPDGTLKAFYYSNNTWTNTLPPVTGESAALAMEPTGTALIAYRNSSDEIETFYFNGTTWVTPTPNPIEVDVARLDVAMNGPNSGVAVWIDFLQNVRSSFFLNGTWSAPTTISTAAFIGDKGVQVAYSANGTAVAAWEDDPTGSIFASNYISGAWQTPVPVNPSTNAQLNDRSLGIDANGNAIVIIRDVTTGNTEASYFNGVSWQLPVIIGPGPDTFNQGVSMSANGTAVAVWEHQNTFFDIYDLYYSQFDGTTWGPAVLFQTGIPGSGPTVSVNSIGDALILWGLDAPPQFQVKVGLLPLGGVLTQEVLYIRDSDIRNVSAALATNGFSAIGWTEDNGETGTPFVAASLITAPPVGGNGFVCKNRFATQTDRINIITWTPSEDLSVVAYEISRNGVLIATIPATGPFIYKDHNRCKIVYTYSIVAIGGDGIPSDPLIIVIN